MATELSVADRLDGVIANLPGVIYRCRLDGDWTMEFISDGIEQLAGYPRSDFLGEGGRSFASIIHPEDRRTVDATVRRAVAVGEPFAPEYRVVRADGSIVWVLERGRATAGSAAAGGQWLDGVIFDITERKVLEEELRRSLAEESANQERLRIARDLHDAVGHALSIGVIQAGGARKVVGTDPASAEDALQAIENCLRTAMSEMRTMVTELHDGPAEVDAHLRLRELLPTATRSGLTVDLRVNGEPRSVPVAVEVSLYRAVQECLTNCIKYASGAAVFIEVTYGERELSLQVSDNGSGCLEPATFAHRGDRGLEGIRHRALALGGTFGAETRLDGGFRVTVSYPI